MRFSKPSLKFTASALTLALLLAQTAFAFTCNIQTREDRLVGTSRHVNLAGTYRLDVTERQLLRVNLITYDAKGRKLSQVTKLPVGMTWGIGVGDFQLVSYELEFVIANKSGTTKTVRTNRFIWGKK